ncbi:MAG: hypothetical protein K9N06_07210 [Candidatus Cloacimonetes bacterium]|nr:hypothetical protein [Candidatus Cloacimonadota bacterium]
MNWIKLIFTGLLAWGIPFVLTELLFPEIPESYAFILILLAAAIALASFSSNVSIGYLRKRFKITVGIGFIIGTTWFFIALLGSGVYHTIIKEENLIDFIIQKAPVYLLYFIISAFHGYCEERRGRRR